MEVFIIVTILKFVTTVILMIQFIKQKDKIFPFLVYFHIIMIPLSMAEPLSIFAASMARLARKKSVKWI